MTDEELPVTESGGALTFPVQVQPRSSRSEVVGVANQFLRVRVTSPPVEGNANEECIRVLSGWLRVSRGAVGIVAGGKSRRKRVQVRGVSRAQLMALLAQFSHD